LKPGDLIFTGTPPGVGMGRKPPLWMKPGDKVVCEIDELGQLSNTVVEDTSAKL
jgi:2-keto-4-pentenoate hydratase/2-oxohepta-3-ene-1,7-dioic acid hydratase in catechol pathway